MKLRIAQYASNSKLIKFLVAGVWNTLFSFLLFYFLLHLMTTTYYQLALLICTIFSILQSHITQRKFIWKSKQPYLAELSKFSVGIIIQYLINSFLLWYLVEILNMGPLLGQVITAPILALGSLYFYRKFVFAGLKFQA